MTVNSLVVATPSVQGVWHVGPIEVLASSPAGSDTSRIVTGWVDAAGHFGSQDEVEHAGRPTHKNPIGESLLTRFTMSALVQAPLVCFHELPVDLAHSHA